MICVQHVKKSYGQQLILDDISVTFSNGVIYGLVGPNGCGKTTFMRCMTGFTVPDSGTILVDGKQIGKEVDFAPKTGLILEVPEFLSSCTALQNLRILARISGLRDENRIQDCIRLVGLDPQNKKPVGKYSLGMRQRLGIAQAIMEDPQNLILDEPFNGLDQQGTADIHTLLQSLKAQGKMILLASHSASDISKACDQVFVIENGKLRCIEK